MALHLYVRTQRNEHMCNKTPFLVHKNSVFACLTQM